MPPVPINGNLYADLLDELADFLALNMNMTMGTNMFVGELPEPDMSGVPITDGIYIIELASPMANDENMYLDTEVHMFDIWSSSQSSSTGKVLLRRVYDILERKGNYALTNWYIYFSYANSTIRDEGRGKERNKLFSLSVTLKCRNLNNIS